MMLSPSCSPSPRPVHLAWPRVSEQTSTLLQLASCNVDDCGQRLGSSLTFFDWSATLSLVGCLVVCSTLLQRGHVCTRTCKAGAPHAKRQSFWGGYVQHAKSCDRRLHPTAGCRTRAGGVCHPWGPGGTARSL